MLVKGRGRWANGGMFRVQKGCLASVKPGVKSFCPPPVGGVLEQPVDSVDWGWRDGVFTPEFPEGPKGFTQRTEGRRFSERFFGVGFGGEFGAVGVGCSPLFGGRKAWKFGPCAPCRGRGGGVRRPCRGGSMRSSTSPRVPAGKPRLHPWLQAATPSGLKAMQHAIPSGLKALEATPCIYSAFLSQPSRPSRTSYFRWVACANPTPAPPRQTVLGEGF